MRADAGKSRTRAGAPFRITAHGRHAASPVPAGLPARICAVALLAGLATGLLLFQYQFRHLEAAVAARLCDIITPTLVAPRAPIVWFGPGTPEGFGLVITPDCSSALLIVPLCLIGVGLVFPRRLRLRRVYAGLLAAAALLVTGNMARIGLIAEMIHLYGTGIGYQLGHLVFGSLLSIVCVATSVAALTLIVARHGSRRAFRFLPRGGRDITT